MMRLRNVRVVWSTKVVSGDAVLQAAAPFAGSNSIVYCSVAEMVRQRRGSPPAPFHGSLTGGPVYPRAFMSGGVARAVPCAKYDGSFDSWASSQSRPAWPAASACFWERAYDEP